MVILSFEVVEVKNLHINLGRGSFVQGFVLLLCFISYHDGNIV